MPQKSKNRFEVNGDTITIMREGWDKLAFATYRKDYFEELPIFKIQILQMNQQKK